MTLDEQIERFKNDIKFFESIGGGGAISHESELTMLKSVLASLEEFKKSLYLLNKLIMFAEEQEKEGLIDGAFDPSIFMTSAKKLCQKHSHQ